MGVCASCEKAPKTQIPKLRRERAFEKNKKADAAAKQTVGAATAQPVLNASPPVT